MTAEKSARDAFYDFSDPPPNGYTAGTTGLDDFFVQDDVQCWQYALRLRKMAALALTLKLRGGSSCDCGKEREGYIYFLIL